MGKLLKKGKELLNKNIGTFILFEILYKGIFVAVAYPALIGIFRLVLKRAGLKYLTNGYIYRFARNPFTIAAVLFIIIVIILYCIFEASALSFIYYESYRRNKVTVAETIRHGFGSFKHTMRRGNHLIMLRMIIGVMTCNIAVLIIVISGLTLPSAVTKVMFGNIWLKAVYIIVFLLALYYTVSGIFTLNYMAIDKMDYKRAKRNSRNSVKNNIIMIIKDLFIYNICVLALYWFLILLLTVIVVLFVKIFNMSSYGMVIFLKIFRIFNSGVTFMLFALAIPGCMLVISRLFEKCVVNHETRKEVDIKYHKYDEKKALFLRKIMVALAIVSIITDGIYVYISSVNNPFDNVELMTLPEVTSHRGNSVKAPENTMSAFEYAIKDMSDYIELDVQETADGELVVIHDPSLKRTTGINKKVASVTLAYIKSLDAGSYFGDEFKDERIPTLRETLEYVDKQVKLNIEIKATDTNISRISKKVADMIEEYELQDDCIVTSMKYDVLKAIKKCNEDIKTGYIISIAYGNFYNMAYVDAFSMNYAFVNKNTVDAVHARGKKVLVWTVNSAEKIENLTALGVDNIITDDPVMAREVIYSKYSYKELVNILNYVFNK